MQSETSSGCKVISVYAIVKLAVLLITVPHSPVTTQSYMPISAGVIDEIVKMVSVSPGRL